MAEQFAFQQLSGNGPTVDRHKRRLTPLGVVVQVARYHFLAGPRLAKDQHAGLGISDLLHHLAHLLDGTTGTYQATEQIRLALTATLTSLVVHFTVDLSTVQRIEQLVVAGRHIQADQDAAAQVFRPLCSRCLTDQQDRQKLITLA